MSWSKLAFERLLDAANEQVTALDRASTSDPARAGARAGHVWRVVERVDRFASLLVVETAGAQAARSWTVARQRWLASKLDELHGRAEPLLERLLPKNTIMARRFATRLSLLDPLARFRGGPDALVDVAGKLITGRSLHDALAYRERERGTVVSPEEVIAHVSLCKSDLSMACLSNVWMLDLDASGAILDETLALEARLSRVNLVGASMYEAELQATLARDCDFSGASLVSARWHGGIAVLCSFVEADLAGLSADGAMFLHCDFRGADLTVGGGSPSATMTGAQFLDCDLRGSRWHGRTLEGGRFIRCKLQGLTGAPLFEGVVIDSPDLSADVNDSKVAL
jgi:uncharacterized protein YjbI with pentapeptide repeats